MKSRKFEDYKKNEVSAPWAILGGEQWVDTVYYNTNNVLCMDLGNKDSYCDETHTYTTEEDVRLLGTPAPPIVG